MRNLYLKDGTIRIINDAEAVIDVELSRLLEDELGRDVSALFTDAMKIHRDNLEADAYDYIEKKVALLENRMDSILFHLKDYLKSPDALENSLKDLHSELCDMKHDWHFTEN